MATSERTGSHADLIDLQTAIRACRKCLEAGYAITPPPVVHGSQTAKVMTIGQAPGPTEVIAQRPFNAGSGRRLFQWLGQAGFDETWFRSTQAMLAVTRCYPGKGKGGHGDRVPSKEEQALCRPWLDQELALIQPKLIIPIGKLALGLFFDPRLSLEELIGTRHEIDGRVFIPLPHPISLGRSSQAMPVRSTNRMPVNARRLDTGGRPLLPLGLSGGSNGSSNDHNSSGNISRATSTLQCSRNGFYRLTLLRGHISNTHLSLCQGFC